MKSTRITNPVESLLLGHAGDRVCGVDRRAGEVTYADMREAVTAYAGRLRAAGVRPGCRSVVVSDDCVAAVTAVLALWWHGCVPILVHPMLRPAEIGFIVRDSEAEFAELNVSPGHRAALRAELDAIDAERRAARRIGLRTELGPAQAGPAAVPPARFGETDELLVQYTSGSTGRPRGVRHCLRAFHAVLRGVGSVLALTPDDIVLSTAKLSFGYGFGNSLLFPYAAGASSVLLDGPVDPYTVAAALEEHRPTVLFSVPRLYAGLLGLVEQGKAIGTGSLRLAVATGERLPEDLAARITETFDVPLLNGFGATEVLHTVVAAAVGPGKAGDPGSIGLPVPGVTATVRDDAGRPVGDEVPGRLHISAESAALGYLNRPEDNDRTFADGGVYTGDIAFRAAGGGFHHVGRSDDMLLLGGYKIAPAEIELVVRELPAVADCAVAGSTDSTGLEQATVYVVPRDPARPDEVRRAVRAALRAGLAPYKRPSRVEVIGELPVTVNGKLARFRLRGAAGAPAGDPRAGT
ncbi:class I adenylate-forming enzyme family protein [Actinomadura livida]|uniref:Acyl-coenzyme A synthetase/AMP-(Fatty) acid ligase n=1 Tax=Actinomadura livida TaxID=79909 RepID=A0A7W7MY72_9ACTN|nr:MULTISPECIES: AMP-binding protein [Actinomadura]MBB4774664.1 acyl-coenzyme A synthetase/AMP-(fatty) acid ligase [Actinomadura catellatispora]GGU06799.1 benzoate--CoA ligase [Actinomadura livida]